MARHIDLIENDWGAGVQTKVASLAVVNGRPSLTTHSGDPKKWERVLELDKVKKLDYGEDEAFLSKHSKRFQGDYLFATEPHDAEECEFVPVAHLQGPGQPAPKIKRTAHAH